MFLFLFSDFEDLAKAYVKTKKVIEQTGIPRFYIKCLVELEDFISDVSILTPTNYLKFILSIILI